MSWAGCQNNPIDVNFHLQKSLEMFEKKSADKIWSIKDKDILTLIGMREGTFNPLSFLDQKLSAEFLSFLEVKIDINQVILTPCPAY